MGRLSFETHILFGLILIGLALAVPLLFSGKTGDDIACIVNMAGVADGTAAPDALCPVSGKPYAITGTRGARTISCPDPHGHLLSDPRFAEAPGGWRFVQHLPAGSDLPGQSAHTFGTLYTTATRSATQTGVVIRVQRRFFVRYLFAPVLLLAGVFLFVGGLWEIGSDPRKIRELLREPLDMGTILLGGMMVVLAFAPVARTTIIEIPGPASGITVTPHYFGKIFTAPRQIDRPVALFPARYGRKQANVVVVYREGDHFADETLFSIRTKDLNMLWGIDRLLYSPGVP